MRGTSVSNKYSLALVCLAHEQGCGFCQYTFDPKVCHRANKIDRDNGISTYHDNASQVAAITIQQQVVLGHVNTLHVGVIISFQISPIVWDQVETTSTPHSWQVDLVQQSGKISKLTLAAICACPAAQRCCSLVFFTNAVVKATPADAFSCA